MLGSVAIRRPPIFSASGKSLIGLGASVVFCAALLVSPHPALAYFTQQGPKLVGTGAVGTANQGISVAVSADGNTAIVGGQSDNSSAGAAWVYTRSGGVWTQQGSKLVGIGAVGPANQGFSVALSAGGNIAVVGGIADNGGIGAAWVFIRSGAGWSPHGSKLTGSDAVSASFSVDQGFSVALSADGTTVVVGGIDDNSFVGAAWVYFQPCLTTAATHDFDGDCRSDILWRHSEGGSTSIWLMNGGTATPLNLGVVPTAWTIVE
jgi:hypothetical protein